jgi:phosphatidylserine/phosphatidylglycerophosphate/cardiolipin synthase-like enzyme
MTPRTKAALARTLACPTVPLALALSLSLPACTVEDDLLDDEHASFPTGKADGAIEEGSAEARAVLALVNDPAVDQAELDDDAGLHRRAATNIITHRNGPDGQVGTVDDDALGSLRELDDVPYVGRVALARLLDYAVARGYLDAERGKRMAVVFSPMPYEQSHNVRVAGLIDGAQHSIDIAMYSYSDARIAAALEAAVARGVSIRFIFDTAYEDRTLTGADLQNSKSGRLERMGINVRYVNKIMHHKLAIIDGPRDVAERAATATIVTGSGNWSNGAATRYDENTLFFAGYEELTLRLQREFNLLWEHSRDLVVNAALPYELSTLNLPDSAIVDDPTTGVLFTSSNFSVSGTTFRVLGRDTVSDELCAAIAGATESIHLASGHLRSRPVAEALMAKRAASPDIDIRVHLDGQEYSSAWAHDEQQGDLEDCLAAAGSDASKIRKCQDNGFLFGYQVGLAGIDVQYKYYAYRWHYAYAVQMHHKYMVIDGDTLYTGSYNLSDNAEHNTFENMFVFSGAELAGLVASFEANFETMWVLGRADNRYAQLVAEVESAALVPLVFAPMALDWTEVTELKAIIKANCAVINEEAYRLHPEEHTFCPRD